MWEIKITSTPSNHDSYAGKNPAVDISADESILLLV